jgi:hypothetical protein
MSFHDPHYPWLFHRDEVDLFEDELDDLYAKYGSDSKKGPLSLEAQVLMEQMETEDVSDAELTLKLGMGMLQERQSEPPSSPLSEEACDDACTRSIRRHPLYQCSRLWAVHLRAFVKAGFERDDQYRVAFFRAFANTNLVPIKIFTALGEEMHDDPMGPTIAEEQYDLALTYLNRVKESLAAILYTVEELDVLKPLQAQADLLQQGITEQLRVLRGRNKRL